MNYIAITEYIRYNVVMVGRTTMLKYIRDTLNLIEYNRIH